MWETEFLNQAQFTLQWFIIFPEFTEFLFHLGKTPVCSIAVVKVTAYNVCNGPFTPAIFSTIAWTWTNRWEMGDTVLYGHIHTCDFLNYCAIFSTIAWTLKFKNGLCTHFCAIFYAISVINSLWPSGNSWKNRRCECKTSPRNSSRNSSSPRNSWENRRCEWTIRVGKWLVYVTHSYNQLLLMMRCNVPGEAGGTTS